MIYRARADFAELLERAGLRQSAVASAADMSRYFLAHVAAGRRNISGVLAARVAAEYATATQMSQDVAMERLFEPVAQKKHAGSPRTRGERGRFVKRNEAPEDDPLPPGSR